MKIDKFLKMDEHLVSIDDIDWDNISSVDYSKIETEFKVTITTKQGVVAVATELNAIEVLMQIRPSALEGKRLRWAKRVWYIHNLIGHPLMQILAMFGLYKAAFWVHDKTVPKPIAFKQNGDGK